VHPFEQAEDFDELVIFVKVALELACEDSNVMRLMVNFSAFTEIRPIFLLDKRPGGVGPPREWADVGRRRFSVQ
jgi:hypothetical protein